MRAMYARSIKPPGSGKCWKAVTSCLSLAISLLIVSLTPAAAADGVLRHTLAYAPSPLDNPLRGLVPYSWVEPPLRNNVPDFGRVSGMFPHSTEFNYLPLSALLVGKDDYNWEPLESLLDDAARRGHQAVFRVYIEYPGKTGVIPPFLLKGGLKVHKYLNTNTQPLPPAREETPDYEDKNLRTALVRFIGALGRKYDGDARIGFIAAGLLGSWGEWHCYPRDDLFASKAVQSEIMDAYEAAFKITPIQLRYPAGAKDGMYAPNANRPFGYHDDSFAWATLDTGKKGDEWFFMSRLKSAGPTALAKWKNHPIGGEIRPEAWGKVFDAKPDLTQIQDFHQCVEETHVTWLMDSGLFTKKQSDARIQQARKLVGRMGYEFHVTAVTVGPSQERCLPVTVELENRGVAPFYYDWSVEYGLVARGKVVKVIPGNGKLTELLSGDTPRIWSDRLDVTGIPAGEYKLLLRVPNKLPSGHPLRFANATQDADVPGWLTLCVVRLRACEISGEDPPHLFHRL